MTSLHVDLQHKFFRLRAAGFEPVGITLSFSDHEGLKSEYQTQQEFTNRIFGTNLKPIEEADTILTIMGLPISKAAVTGIVVKI